MIIQFGKSAAKVEEEDDKVTVTFEDGTSLTADTVVGCDGSKEVRYLCLEALANDCY
jgi:2-polyprenyl-6-methoxyphenol hydroxylase-like FAD-dependent oxidoreductase